MFLALCRCILVPIYLFTQRPKLVRLCSTFAVQNPTLAPQPLDCNYASFLTLGLLSGFALFDALIMIYSDVIVYSLKSALADGPERYGVNLKSSHSYTPKPMASSIIGSRNGYGTLPDEPMPNPNHLFLEENEPQPLLRSWTGKATWGSSWDTIVRRVTNVAMPVPPPRTVSAEENPPLLRPDDDNTSIASSK
ncbi:hypothetical protein BC829DRAFT_219592 [Chytridium lagenaria]|nr:hypothetical protein BC829DRAFT_219592 [Chytridium lagenaria]